jgi:hypothetical protein
MAVLELLGRQTVPGLSLKVVHEQPEQLAGKSAWTAMALFAALEQNANARTWFIKHIRNAVVHCAAAPDGIAVLGDSIHFFETKDFSADLGARLFDRLTPTQKQDFAQLHAGRDARQEFAAFLKAKVIAVITHPDEHHLRALAELLSQLWKDHSSTVLLTKTIGTEAPGVSDDPNGEDWSDERNRRRIDLIDKDIQGHITIEERAELAELQRQAVVYRDHIAPLPIEGARRLHRQLLERKRQQTGSE